MMPLETVNCVRVWFTVSKVVNVAVGDCKLCVVYTQSGIYWSEIEIKYCIPNGKFNKHLGSKRCFVHVIQ